MTDSQFDRGNKINDNRKRAKDQNLDVQSSQNQSEDENLFANFDGHLMNHHLQQNPL